MEENRDIRGLLQDQFANFEAEPGVDLWAGIEANLETGSPPRKRRLGVWISIAASIVLLLGMIWLLWPTSSPAGEPILAEQHPIPPQIKQESAREKPVNKVPTEVPPPSQENASVQLASVPVTPSTPAVQTIKTQSKNTETNEIKIPEEDLLAAETPDIQIAPISPLAATSWGSSPSKPSAPSVPKAVVADKSVKQKKSKREIFYPKNQINLNELTLGQALGFASTEISKITNSPMTVTHERGTDEEVSTYELNFLNIHFASNETTKSSQEPEQKQQSKEPQEEVSTYQLDLFNFRIKKKTHKRVINKMKS